MRIDIITIFPEYFSPLGVSLLGKAAARGTIDLRVHDLRQWAADRPSHRGRRPLRRRAWHGDGARPLGRRAGRGDRDAPGARLVVPTPSGIPFTQASALKYSRSAHLSLLVGDTRESTRG